MALWRVISAGNVIFSRFTYAGQELYEPCQNAAILVLFDKFSFEVRLIRLAPRIYRKSSGIRRQTKERTILARHSRYKNQYGTQKPPAEIDPSGAFGK